jgi:hypothetical protein
MAGGLVAALVLAACGSARPAASSHPAAAADEVTPLATSMISPDGTSWAIVDMGGLATQHQNFWQLFTRPAASPTWRLATPLGVADNGGLVVAATGANSMVTGFRPSQDLTFSPLASTADGGANWSPGGPLPGGLANAPDALAAGPAGQLIAVTSSGGALLRTGPQAGWTRLTTLRQLAATAAGRSCGLTALTGAAFGPGGTVLLAGDCGRARQLGIFAQAGGTWTLRPPVLPDYGSTRVLSLATAGSVTTAVIGVGSGQSGGLVVAWLNAGGDWTSSAELHTGSATVLSASIWPGGAAGVVLSGSSAAVLTGPSARWQRFGSLPASTATLARGPDGQVEALSAKGATASVWDVKSGSWALAQTIKVQIPYGSSG